MKNKIIAHRILFNQAVIKKLLLSSDSNLPPKIINHLKPDKISSVSQLISKSSSNTEILEPVKAVLYQYQLSDEQLLTLITKLRTYVNVQFQTEKIFAENAWTETRQTYGVGEGRNCVRHAIARNIEYACKTFLQPGNQIRIDVGSGPGYLLKLLLPEYKAIPFDINPNFLNESRAKGLCDFGIQGNAYNLAQILRAGFPDGVDVIFGLDSFDTFHDLTAVLKQCFLALKSGGKFMFFQALKIDSAAIYQEAIIKGMIYNPELDLFFRSLADFKLINDLTNISKASGSFGNINHPDFIRLTQALMAKAVNGNLELFLPRMRSGLSQVGFKTLYADGSKSNVLVPRENYNRHIASDFGNADIPNAINYLSHAHGVTKPLQAINIPDGKILEESEMLVFVAEKP